MSPTDFDRFEQKLKTNVYGSVKGRIRLELIKEDLEDFFPEFTSKRLNILDIGGGEGHFAALCLQYGHNVLLCDSSARMLEKAQSQWNDHTSKAGLQLLHADFLENHPRLQRRFDLVLMHGSAEWMKQPEAAIRKACSLCSEKGILSLLIFNRDKYMLKQGINGHLIHKVAPKKKKLIPPGAMPVDHARQVLESENGRILLQSGIRVFHRFFRHIDANTLTAEQWLEQERSHYRTPPFSLLGEHSHFLCRFSPAPSTPFSERLS